MLNFLTRIFGSRNERLLKAMSREVRAATAFEPALQALSDEALKAKTEEFRARLAAGAKLDQLLPEAFAVVREASRRVLGMRHFDVQLIGGMALHRGRIAEMRTGEGKTLMATLPAYLNALPTVATSPTAPTTNSVSTICAITSLSVSKIVCSASSRLRSSTKSTPS